MSENLYMIIIIIIIFNTPIGGAKGGGQTHKQTKRGSRSTISTRSEWWALSRVGFWLDTLRLGYFALLPS